MNKSCFIMVLSALCAVMCVALSGCKFSLKDASAAIGEIIFEPLKN